jgi:hypothetical protein
MKNSHHLDLINATGRKHQRLSCTAVIKQGRNKDAKLLVTIEEENSEQT